MDSPEEVVGLYEGKVLRMVRRGRWEYVERKKNIKAAFICALTDERKLLVVKEFRIPLNRWVVGFPAGLIGDTEGLEDEAVEEAVKRELIEEAGYEAKKVTVWTEGPTSAGLTSEVISLVFAEGLKKVGTGGGLPSENIQNFEIPLRNITRWLAKAEAEDCIVDPKIYACLYFLGKRKINRSSDLRSEPS